MMFRWLRDTCAGSMAVAALLLPNLAKADWSDVPPSVRDEIVGSIALVGRVWPDDASLTEFHQVLAKRYKDTPALEHLKSQEAWVSVITSRSVRTPGVFMARSPGAMALNRGDIVRVRIAHFRKVDSYFQLNTVEDVLCRASAPDYAECAKSNPLSWKLKSGDVVAL